MAGASDAAEKLDLGRHDDPAFETARRAQLQVLYCADCGSTVAPPSEKRSC